eukprot:1802574-Amphidinium_carterae.1
MWTRTSSPHLCQQTQVVQRRKSQRLHAIPTTPSYTPIHPSSLPSPAMKVAWIIRGAVDVGDSRDVGKLRKPGQEGRWHIPWS